MALRHIRLLFLENDEMGHGLLHEYCSQLKSAQVVRISAVPAGGLTCRLAPGSRTTRSGRRATVFVWSQNSDALGRSDHPEFDGWSRNRY